MAPSHRLEISNKLWSRHDVLKFRTNWRKGIHDNYRKQEITYYDIETDNMTIILVVTSFKYLTTLLLALEQEDLLSESGGGSIFLFPIKSKQNPVGT